MVVQKQKLDVRGDLVFTIRGPFFENYKCS